jgi:hypothetical protein
MSNRTQRLAEQLSKHRESRLVKDGLVYRAKTVTASAPGQGPYYWVPKPDGTWVLRAYVVGREDNSPDHSIYWREVVAPYMAELWGKESDTSSIKRLPYGVPRGRVSYFDKTYYLNHGGDSPELDWESKILGEFNLLAWARHRPNQLKVYADGHEKMLGQERSQINKLLGAPSD